VPRMQVPNLHALVLMAPFPRLGLQKDMRISTDEPSRCSVSSRRGGPMIVMLGEGRSDGFEDQWIDAGLRDRDAVKNFSQRVEQERPSMELRYMRDVADDRGLDWEYKERVLSSRDLDEWMRQGW